MIDMTFQLIAFFMVLINTQSKQNDKVVLPTSELAKPVDAAPIEFPIIVHLTSTGSIVIGGDEMGLGGLRSRLAPELSLLKLEGKSTRDPNIIIRGHRDVPGGRSSRFDQQVSGIGL